MLHGILSGLQHCHSMNIMHRDIKPGNVLLDASLEVVKVADFGLCRVMAIGESKATAKYSHQVSTRWYRAPEILFGSETYTEKIDLWSVGAVAAEMMKGEPLFKGMNDIDQIVKVFQVLGTPTEENWPQMTGLPDYGKILFKPCKEQSLDQVLPKASTSFRELVQSLIIFDETRRPSCSQTIAKYLDVEKKNGN